MNMISYINQGFKHKLMSQLHMEHHFFSSNLVWLVLGSNYTVSNSTMGAPNHNYLSPATACIILFIFTFLFNHPLKCSLYHLHMVPLRLRSFVSQFPVSFGLGDKGGGCKYKYKSKFKACQPNFSFQSFIISKKALLFSFLNPKKGTPRQPFLKFSKKGPYPRAFFQFSKKMDYPPAIFQF